MAGVYVRLRESPNPSTFDGLQRRAVAEELKTAPGADREMQVAPQAARNTLARIRRATQGDGESSSEE